jgi:acetolactate synthase-1/2/3 large subunit
VKTLADAGMTVISSTHGRGILPDSHRASLRASIIRLRLKR